MKHNKRIGLFGGLFDPPHLAHLILAQAVLEEFRLSEILFIPSYNPPHKRRFSPYNIRRKMLERAIKENPRFKLTDIESSWTGKTYTVDILKTLKKNITGDMFLIIGSDQWIDIKSWKTPNEIGNFCRLIIIPRPGFTIMEKKLKGSKIMVGHTPGIGISSTMIRNLVASGRSIRYLVPRTVEKYIKQKKLYIAH